MIKNVMVDCDPGHDDIMAIMSILAHREAFNLLGLTTVNGNNLVDRVTDNLLKVLTYLDVDLKVAKGYDKPLVYDADPQIAHGESGLDGPVLPASKFSVVDMHAIEFMKQMAQTHDKITIIALAPLTNVALFLKTYPELKEIWNEIGAMHKELHQTGSKIINALFDEDYESVDTLYQNVIELSDKLIQKLEQLNSSF